MADVGSSSINITANTQRAEQSIRRFYGNLNNMNTRIRRGMERNSPFDPLTRGMRTFDRTIGMSIRNLPEHLKPFHQALNTTRREMRTTTRYTSRSLEEMSRSAINSRVELNRVFSATDSGKKAAKNIQQLTDSVRETQLAILGLNEDGTVQLSTQESTRRLERFREEVKDTERQLEALRDAGDFASYEAGMRSVERQLAQVDQAMRAAARGGRAYNQMINELGINTSNMANEQVIAMENMRHSFFRNLDLMQARSTQSQNMIKILPDVSHIQAIDRAFLNVGNRLEQMARQGTAAAIAVQQLGRNASMKDILDRVKLINQGLMRMQQVAIATGIVFAGFTAVMFNAAKGPSVADVLQEQTEAMENYQTQLQQRTEQIENTWNIFEDIQLEKTSPSKLMANLNEQVEAMKNWNQNLSNIASRTSSDFANYLSNLGPEAAGQIAALNRMSDSELNKYVALWQEKHRLARTRATSELAQLKAETDQKIKELQNSLTPLGISLERAQGAWAQALGPFVDIWGRIAAKILDASTALANFINRMNQVNDDISQMGGMFAYLFTAITLILSPMAIGIGRAAGMAAAFSFLWTTIGPLVLGLLRIAGIASVLSAAIIVVVGSIMKMWGASEQLRTSVTGAFTQLKQIVSNAIEPLVPALTKLKNTVQDALISMTGAKNAGSFWQAMGDLVARVINYIVDAVLPKFKAGLDAVVGFIVQIAPKIGNMVQAIAGFIKTLVGVVTNGNSVIGKVFQVTWSVIQFLLVSAWGNIKAIVTSGIAIITNLFQLFTNILQGNWKAAWNNLLAILKNLVILIWNYINLMFLGRIVGVFKSFFVGALTLFKTGWSKISFNVQYFLLRIWEYISNTYTRMTTATGNAFKSMLNWARSILNSMWSFIKSIFKTIYNFFVDTMRRISIAFSNGWRGVQSLTTSFLKAVWNFISSNFNRIYNFYVNILRRIYVTFQSGWRSVYNITMSIFNSVYQFLSKIFSNIYNTLSRAVTNTKNFIVRGWQSLWDNTKTIFNNIKKWIEKTYDDVVAGAKKLPGRIGKGIKSMASSVKGGALAMANTLADALGKGVNGAISGLNWVLDKIGVKKEIPKWDVPHYRRGTGTHPGGWFVAGDGGKEELIRFSDGRMTLSPPTDTLYYGDKGTEVLSGRDTEQLKKSGLLPFYDTGIGAAIKKKKDELWEATKSTATKVKNTAVSAAVKAKDFTLDVFEYMSNPKELIQKVFANFVPSLPSIPGAYGDILKGSMVRVKDQSITYVKKLFNDTLGGDGGYTGKVPAGSGVKRWAGLATRALIMTGQYTKANLDRLLYQMQTESGGNPRAINLWDINATKYGTPSKGLLQVIDPTFSRFAMPGYNKNIYDPLSNMLASIRYAVSRYGSLARAYQGRGYKFGGIINSPEIAALAENGRPEAVVPLVGRAMDPFAVGVARKLGEMFTSSVVTTDSSSANDGPYVFQVNLNGRQVAQQIFDDLEQLKKRSTYQKNRARGEVDY